MVSSNLRGPYKTLHKVIFLFIVEVLDPMVWEVPFPR